VARAQLTRAALDYLDELQEGESAPDFAINQLRRSWTARIERIEAGDGDEQAAAFAAASYRQLRRDLLAMESAELDRLHSTGEVTDSTRRRVQRLPDLAQAGLADDAE
jgi:monovalent cation/hydrogen antiporter